MKQYLSLTALPFLIFCIMNANAQTPYKYNSDGTHAGLNDLTWNTTTLILNEEFNSETDTKTRWKYHWLGSVHYWNDDQFYLEGDQSLDNLSPTSPFTYNFNNSHNHTYQTASGVTSMKLTTRFESPAINTYFIDGTSGYSRQTKTYYVSTGVAISKMAYRYGFFEARLKVNKAGNQIKGVGNCFWLFGDYNDANPISGVPNKQSNYSEIDIAENDPARNVMTCGSVYRKYPTDLTYVERHSGDDDRYHIYNADIVNSRADYIVNQQEYHTYSLEWTPTEMNTYYDNYLVRHMEYPAGNMDYMNIILDIEGAIHNYGYHQRFYNLITPGVTNLPFDFEIDFVKVYKLNIADCASSFNTTTGNYDFVRDGYNYSLKSAIKLGQNGSSSASVLVHDGQKISVRAVEYIDLEDGFEVDAATGTEFFATTNGTCDN